mgnify:CR=1 FL=1
MKKSLVLLLLFLSATVFAQDINGKWNGLLKFTGGQLRLSINITKTATGYSATMDSPDQGAAGIPVTTITFANNDLMFAIPAGGIEYKGKYDGKGFTGTFSQNGFAIPLTLGRDEVELVKVKRPQDPAQPYPYREEEVAFQSGNIKLAGTLTLPAKEGVYPAVVLITGSGPQNRDEELMDHRPFLVLADYLTRNGIAVLRYDDRGVAKSEGNFETATTKDFADDAAAAFKYLNSRKDINKKKIGLIGHSEGGIIAPMVAVENPEVAFIVLMAGTAIPGDDLMMLQSYSIGKAGGMPEEELKKLSAINRQAYNIIKQERNPRDVESKLTQLYAAELKPVLTLQNLPAEKVQEYIDMQVSTLTSPWYINFIKYDPAPTLAKVKCPILAINGDKDLQVSAKANLPAITRATEKGGNKRVTVKSLPGLNHLFQEAATGQPSEYAKIEQTISPIALAEIQGWVQKQVK